MNDLPESAQHAAAVAAMTALEPTGAYLTEETRRSFIETALMAAEPWLRVAFLAEMALGMEELVPELAVSWLAEATVRMQELEAMR